MASSMSTRTLRHRRLLMTMVATVRVGMKEVLMRALTLACERVNDVNYRYMNGFTAAWLFPSSPSVLCAVMWQCIGSMRIASNYYGSTRYCSGITGPAIVDLADIVHAFTGYPTVPLLLR
jgi:hypothetical protein